MDTTLERSVITCSQINYTEEKELVNLYGSTMVVTNPGQLIMPYSFFQVAEKIKNFTVRHDDIWILSYPRTGSNWLQEMTWLIENNLRFDAAKQTELCTRSILLEGSAMLSGHYAVNQEETIDQLKNGRSPRHIKSHLPWNYLPTQLEKIKPNVVYVARNPKDVCVSNYLFLKINFGLRLPFDAFCDLFMLGKVVYGNYLEHVLSFWKLRKNTNILFLKYEDMKQDTEGVIRQVSEFLGKSISDQNLKDLAEHVSFQKMSNNPAVSRQCVVKSNSAVPELQFTHRGEVGEWRTHMSPEMVEKFNAWTSRLSKKNKTLYETLVRFPEFGLSRSGKLTHVKKISYFMTLYHK